MSRFSFWNCRDFIGYQDTLFETVEIETLDLDMSRQIKFSMLSIFAIVRLDFFKEKKTIEKTCLNKIVYYVANFLNFFVWVLAKRKKSNCFNKPKNNIKVNFKIKNCFSLLYQQLCESKIFWWKLTHYKKYRKKFIISNLDVDDTSWQKCYRNSDYFFFVWEGSHLRQTERITNWDWKKICM